MKSFTFIAWKIFQIWMINTNTAFVAAAAVGSFIHCFWNIHSVIISMKIRQRSKNWNGTTTIMWNWSSCRLKKKKKQDSATILYVTVPSWHDHDSSKRHDVLGVLIPNIIDLNLPWVYNRRVSVQLLQIIWGANN